MTKQTVSYRRTEITLFQDKSGFWGWTIGKETMIAMFAHRDSAFSSAKRHIDNNK